MTFYLKIDADVLGHVFIKFIVRVYKLQIIRSKVLQEAKTVYIAYDYQIMIPPHASSTFIRYTKKLDRKGN